MALFERWKQKAFDECVPLTITLELTLRCNLRCVHCYNFDRDQPYLLTHSQKDELSDEEITRVIGEVREAGCLYLALSGGESLSHPSLDTFVAQSARLGMMVTVKTNGTMLDAERAQRLAEAGCAAVEISVYGAIAPTHDAFVKMPGAFERTLRGIEAARAAGMKAKLSLVLARGNAAEADGMLALATSLGVPYALDPQLTARYDGSRGSLDERVDPATLEQLYRGPLRHLVPPPVDNPTSVQCACARSVAGISAFGEVYPCIGAPLPSGNIRDRSFAEIWRSSPTLNWIRGLRLDDFSSCKACDHLSHCRRSSGVVYANTGDYTGPPRYGDDWTCAEAEVLHRLHDEGIAVDGEKTPASGALRRHSRE
jgi:radical SAM protein with 4Fe4S-binding SPASM domain